MCNTGTSNGGKKVANGTFSSGFIHRITLNIIERLCCFDFLVPCTNPVQTLYKPCANHGHARMALVMPRGHSVWLTPISRGRVSHSDSGLNTVGGVLSCPWFVNDWHSLRIIPLSDAGYFLKVTWNVLWGETIIKQTDKSKLLQSYPFISQRKKFVRYLYYGISFQNK